MPYFPRLLDVLRYLVENKIRLTFDPTRYGDIVRGTLEFRDSQIYLTIPRCHFFDEQALAQSLLDAANALYNKIVAHENEKERMNREEWYGLSPVALAAWWQQQSTYEPHPRL